MKEKNTFIFKGLISLVLSLTLVFGTVATSLATVSENKPVAEAAAAPQWEYPQLDDQLSVDADVIAEPSASAPDSEQPTVYAAIAEGSLDAVPVDDEVLDVDLQSTDEPQEKPVVNRKADVELAATGTAVTSGSLDTSKTYYLGADSDTYRLVYESGWKVKNSSNQYLTITSNDGSASISWTNNGTSLTASSANSSGVTLSCTITANYRDTTYYLTYSSGSFSANTAYYDYPRIAVYEADVTPTEAPTSAPTEAPTDAPTDPPSGTITIYFTNNRGWTDSSVCVYLWNDASVSTGTTVQNAAWPGVRATYVGTNELGESVFSATVDTTIYDHAIFLGTNPTSNSTEQTVNINVPVLTAQGNGVYCLETTDGGSYNIGTYTYGSDDKINYSKKIEKKDSDSYRLHLTVDGSALEGSSTETTGGGNDGKGLVIIIDTTETMTATSGVWDPENKFRAAQHLLQESGGLIDNFLNSGENNTVTVIGIHGLAGQGTYTDLITTVASGDKLSDFSGDWNDSHTSHNISYVTGFLYVDDYLQSHNDEDTTVVFITGNDPETYVSYSGGERDPADPRYTWSRGSTAKDWRSSYTEKTLNDYQTLMTEHPELTFYSVGIKPVERGDSLLQDMGTYSRGLGRGDYFSADTKDSLSDIFETIQTIIIPGDKTSNITVTDTLSEYVDFASDVNVTAKIYKGDDTTGEDIAVTVNRETKTISYTHAAEITGPFKIELAFDIKTADGVFVPENGYPHIGYYDTDYYSVSAGAVNTTSSGKEGYYSNTSATLSYTLNDTAATKNLPKPVVQAPVKGAYIFRYQDRYKDWQTVTVNVPLKEAELQDGGYSGNGNQAGVPTFLWTSEAQTLFNSVNPLVTAALALEGNAENGGSNWQKDASVYKNDLVWNNLVATTQGSNVSYNAETHTVTVTATTTPYTFTLVYYTVENGTSTRRGLASGLPYGKAVTFNPIYTDSQYSYVNYTVPSEGFSYWSADEAGNIPITTNLTYGMIMRGDYTDDNDNDRTVHIYAQYNKTISEAWKPLIEEVKLTRTIDDDHDWVYLDYMTNYLSQAGTVVQEMEVKPEYGIVVAKYSSESTTLNQAKMESVANAMITGNKSSAYLNSEKTAIAYRFNYSDNEHISDFNRVLYTLKSNTDKAENMQFTAIAYIVVDGTKYYSPINTDITVIDLV